jgi:hypothetical protein
MFLVHKNLRPSTHSSDATWCGNLGFDWLAVFPVTDIRERGGQCRRMTQSGHHGDGWLFPKADHLNVGIYTWDGDAKLSKEQFRAYSVDRLGTDKLEDVVGFPISFGGHRHVPNRDRIILVGDAAGFAEPFLG